MPTTQSTIVVVYGIQVVNRVTRGHGIVVEEINSSRQSKMVVSGFGSFLACLSASSA